MHKIKMGSDNIWRWDKFTNTSTGAKIEAGTVTGKLYDDGEVGGPTQLGATITLSHIADGRWEGTIADTHADLVDGMTVRCELTADGGAGLLRLKKELAIVEQVE